MTLPERWPTGRRLLLLRHGETYEPRLDAPMAGPDEDPQLPLTERGRERLQEIAAWIARVPIERAYASPYRRAQETAQIVAEPHGLSVATLGALSELPDDQSRVIQLAYYGGFSHSEIAKMLNEPLGTIKGRMRLGMDKIRAALGEGF